MYEVLDLRFRGGDDFSEWRVMPNNNLPPDPFADRTFAAYGADLRAGRVTAERVTRDYLDRIEALAPRLTPYVQVTAERAMQTARGIDQVLAGGTDLGPLMGVPVAVKDLFAVEGTDTRAGSRLDVKDIIGPEGSFVKKLKRAGCIVLGKTSTTEFALGSFNFCACERTAGRAACAAGARGPG